MNNKKSEKAIGSLTREDFLAKLFYQKLLQKTNAFIMLVDSKGRIVFGNRKYLKFFGFSKKDIIKKNWIVCMIPKDKRRKVREIFTRIKKQKKLLIFDSSSAGVSGIEHFHCWTAFPVKEHRAIYYLFIGQKRKCVHGEYPIKSHVLSQKKLEAAYGNIIGLFFEATRRIDPDTARHSERVMILAVALAKKMRIRKKQIEKIRIAALLHDLGKLAVDKKILFKKGKLTDKEFQYMKKHSSHGADALRQLYFMHEVTRIMYSHHEGYDGGGYPHGLRGENIPLEARVLTVADIYEALTADRPYRKGFSRKKAFAIMEYEKGHKLDPKITDIFLEMMRSTEFKEKGF